MYLTCFDIFVLYCFYCVLSCDSDKLLFDDQLCELYFFLPKVIHSLVFNLFFLKSILIHGQDRNVKEVIPLLSLPFQSKLGFRTSASCIKDVSDLS